MYVKDAGGGGGSSSSSKSYSSYKNTSSNTEDNSGPSAAELFAAAKRKVYREIKEYTKEAREYVKKINTSLENVSNIIQDALTGGTAQVIRSNISNAIKNIINVGNQLGNIYEKANQKEKEYGGISDSNLSPMEKEGPNIINNKNPSIYHCDTNLLRNNVMPLLNGTNSYFQKATETTSKIPIEEGCESVSQIAPKLNNIKDSVKKIIDEVLDAIDKAEEAERKNTIVVNDLFSSLLNSNDKKTSESSTNSKKSQNYFGTLYDNSISKKMTYVSNNKNIIDMLANKLEVNVEGKPQSVAIDTIEAKIFADKYNIDTTGKTTQEIVKEVADKVGVDAYEKTISKNEMPLINQLDYENIKFGSSNIKISGSAPTSLCMLGSWATGSLITPDELMKNHPEFNKYYSKENGGSELLLKDEAALNELNLKYENKYAYEKAWIDGELEKSLEKGYVAIWRTTDKRFTQSVCYIAVSGITEDGKLILKDPNGNNYESSDFLKNGYSNGFDMEDIASCGGDFYIFSSDNEVQNQTSSMKPNSVILSDINEKLTGTVESDLYNTINELKEENKNITISNEKNTDIQNVSIENSIEDIEEKNLIESADSEIYYSKSQASQQIKTKWDSGYLTARKGFIDYHTNDGTHYSETWCPLEVNGLVQNIRKYEGINYEQWTREDGVQMYGPYVMVAADVKQREEWSGGRENAKYEYGDIVETSLGTGIVIDYCERSENTRIATNGEQTHFDIYTKWHDGGKYGEIGYSEEYTQRDIAPSPNEIGNANYASHP